MLNCIRPQRQAETSQSGPCGHFAIDGAIQRATGLQISRFVGQGTVRFADGSLIAVADAFGSSAADSRAAETQVVRVVERQAT